MDNMLVQRDHSPIFWAREIGPVAAAMFATLPGPVFNCSLADGASVVDFVVDVSTGVEVATEGFTSIGLTGACVQTAPPAPPAPPGTFACTCLTGEGTCVVTGGDIGADDGVVTGGDIGADDGVVTGGDIGAETCVVTGGDIGAETCVVTGAGTGADIGAGAGVVTGADIGADTGVVTGTYTGTDIGAETGVVTGTNTGIDAGAGNDVVDVVGTGSVVADVSYEGASCAGCTEELHTPLAQRSCVSSRMQRPSQQSPSL